MKKKERIKKLSIGIIIILIALMLTYLVGKPLVRLLEDTDSLKLFIEEYGFFGKIALVLIAAVQVIFALIPSEALEIAAGYLFGTVEATILCLVGICLGSTIVIFLTQKFGRKFVNLFYSDKKIDEIKLFKNEKKLGGLLFLIFLIPGTPKDIVTYVVGLTKVKISTYLLITSLARTPSIVISTIAGSAFAESKYNMAILFFGLSALTGAIGFLIYKFYFTKKEKVSK